MTVRVEPDVRARWHALAQSLDIDLSELIRQLLEERFAARTGGVSPPVDAAFAEMLEDLRMRYGVRDPSEIIRMAVTTAWRRDRAGVNPWLPEAVKSGAEAPSPPSPPAHPGGKRRT